MPQLPRDSAPDSTLALLSEGYGFISNRCRRHGSDIFEMRLILRKAVCMQGEEAAHVFHSPGRFTRRGALQAPAESAIQVFPRQLDSHGKPLDASMMAVGLLNLRRPTMAIARFVTFAALALHEHSEQRLQLIPRVAATTCSTTAAPVNGLRSR